jgi:hypothetical protein
MLPSSMMFESDMNVSGAEISVIVYDEDVDVVVVIVSPDDEEDDELDELE